MSIRDQLCAAFCAGIELREVPAGFAIGTPFEKGDGDRVGFFLVADKAGHWRLEDDGLTIPMLIASGVDIEHGERAAEFERMLSEAEAEYDPGSGELRTPWMEQAAIAATALRFTALLMRIVDLQMLHPDKVASTFRQDVMAEIHRRFEGRVAISEDLPPAPELADFVADVVLTPPNAEPLAVFIATSDARIFDAVMTRTIARYQLRKALKVAAVLESERPKGVSQKAQQRARNYLDAAPSFKGDRAGSISRLEEMIFDVSSPDRLQ